MLTVGITTNASLFIESPKGSKCSEISIISSELISLISAPCPAGGQLPETINFPPVIPIPGSLPTDPRTIIVPPDIPAPAFSPACPRTRIVPFSIESPTKLDAEPCTLIIPPFM